MASILLWRIVERQTKVYEYDATSTDHRAEILQAFIERSKPQPYFSEWHDLIATPFRYPLPVLHTFHARFRPPNSQRNVLYASEQIATCLHEHAYHFYRLRKGMTKIPKTGQRTLFSLKLIPGAVATNIRKFPNWKKIVSPKDYSASHRFVDEHPKAKIIRYPSCRDPRHRDNYAVLDIRKIEKNIGSEEVISFSFDNRAKKLNWFSLGVKIDLENQYRDAFLESIERGVDELEDGQGIETEDLERRLEVRRTLKKMPKK